jgi:hypothetical protein
MIDNNVELMDYVAEALPLLRDRDKNAWELGDIVAEAVDKCGIEIKPGRKKLSEDTVTLGDFASMLNTNTPRVSEWLKCSALFPLASRPYNLQTHEDLTWGHYNLARRKAGGDLESAMDLLDYAVALHLGYNAFKRWLNGEIWEGYLDADELPQKVRPFATKPERQVWATFKYGDE